MAGRSAGFGGSQEVTIPSWFIYQIPPMHFKCILGTEESAFVIYFHFKEPLCKRGTKEGENTPLPGTVTRNFQEFPRMEGK